ncbi:TPR repeat-containing protein YfgC precursor [Phycisphaerae bacterium RAS1]|nr:TPR repeat-containing protein YfgC precursor [Phycisphaerae bacterium RAS1]
MRPSHAMLIVLLLLPSACARRLAPIEAGRAFEPDQREQRLWEATRRMSAELAAGGVRCRDDALERYVQAVLDKLIEEDAAAFAPLTPRVLILDCDIPNAFSLPHGDIYVHTGILARLRNEAQLAMLLGHELTHATHRHVHAWREDAYLRTGAGAYVSVLSSPAGYYSNAIGALSQVLTLAAVSGFSRENEAEADRVGMQRMAFAGYDPREAPRLFERMLEAADSKGRRWNFLYATHPRMKARVASCQRLLANVARSGPATVGEAEYLSAAGELIYAEVRRHLAIGRFDLALQTAQFLCEKSASARAYALLGDVFRERGAAGDGAAAEASYLQALQLDGEAAEVHRGLGLLALRRGDRPVARAHLARYLQSCPDAPDAALIRSEMERIGGDE